MKLDRTVHPPRGKYAIIKLREATVKLTPFADRMVMVEESAVDFGDSPDTEFFVIRLKDKYAGAALHAYADAAWQDDGEYAAEVQKLAVRADNHPNKRKPD